MALTYIYPLAVSYSTHPSNKNKFVTQILGGRERDRDREMRRKAMFTVGKTKGVASLMHRRPFQHMVLRRLRELKKIVPDAHDANVNMLLRQTAEYICILELKVTVLRRLTGVYGA